MDHRLIQPNDKLELKLSSEMDDTLLKSIHDEYFKKTCVYPLIAILISLSVMALWIVRSHSEDVRTIGYI